MYLWHLNLGTSRGVASIAFVCVLFMFLHNSFVHDTILSLNLIEYSYNYMTTGEMV